MTIIEYSDNKRVEKLRQLTDITTFWTDVKRMTRQVKSDHSISRWQCLAEERYQELEKESKKEYEYIWSR